MDRVIAKGPRSDSLSGVMLRRDEPGRYEGPRSIRASLPNTAQALAENGPRPQRYRPVRKHVVRWRQFDSLPLDRRGREGPQLGERAGPSTNSWTRLGRFRDEVRRSGQSRQRAPRGAHHDDGGDTRPGDRPTGAKDHGRMKRARQQKSLTR